MVTRSRARLAIVGLTGLALLVGLVSLRRFFQSNQNTQFVDASKSPKVEAHVVGSPAIQASAPGVRGKPGSPVPAPDLAEPKDVLREIARRLLSGAGGWRNIAFAKTRDLDRLFDDQEFLSFLKDIHKGLGTDGSRILTQAYGLAKSRTYQYVILAALSEYHDSVTVEFLAHALESAKSPMDVNIVALSLCRIGSDAAAQSVETYFRCALDERRPDLIARMAPALGRLGVRAVELLLEASEQAASEGPGGDPVVLSTFGPLTFVRPGNDLSTLVTIAKDNPSAILRAMAASAIARGESSVALPALLSLYVGEGDPATKVRMLSSLTDLLPSCKDGDPQRPAIVSVVADILRTATDASSMIVALRAAAFLQDAALIEETKALFQSSLTDRFSPGEGEELRGNMLVTLSWENQDRAQALVRDWMDRRGVTDATARDADACLASPNDEALREKLHQYLTSGETTPAGIFHVLRILGRYPSHVEATVEVMQRLYWDPGSDPMTRLRLIDSSKEMGPAAVAFLRGIGDKELERLPRFAALDSLLQMPGSRMEGGAVDAILQESRSLIVDATSRDPRVDVTYLQAGVDGQYEPRLNRFASFVRDVYALGGGSDDVPFLQDISNRLPLADAPMSDGWKQRIRSTMSEAGLAAIDTIKWREGN